MFLCVVKQKAFLGRKLMPLPWLFSLSSVSNKMRMTVTSAREAKRDKIRKSKGWDICKDVIMYGNWCLESPGQIGIRNTGSKPTHAIFLQIVRIKSSWESSLGEWESQVSPCQCYNKRDAKVVRNTAATLTTEQQRNCADCVGSK